MLSPLPSFSRYNVSPVNIEDSIIFEGLRESLPLGSDLTYGFCVRHVYVDAPRRHYQKDDSFLREGIELQMPYPIRQEVSMMSLAVAILEELLQLTEAIPLSTSLATF